MVLWSSLTEGKSLVEQVYAYFTRAWQIVLGRLERRFAVGPIDWDDPYAPSLE